MAAPRAQRGGMRAVIWTLAVACLAFPAGADAQRKGKGKAKKAAVAAPDPDAEARVQAREHYNKGTELLGTGQYKEAIAEFEEAYRAKPHYVVLFNIGMAYVELEDPVMAVEVLERYLSEGGDKGEKARLEQATAELAKQRAQMGWLDLALQPDQAEVLIDGAAPRDDFRAGSVRLKAGTHTLDATAEGFVQHSQQFEVFGGEHTSLQVDLYPPEAARPEVIATAPPAATEDKAGGRGARSTIGIVLGSVGVAVAGTALGLFLANNGRYSDWEDEDAELKDIYAPGAPFVDDDVARRQSENDDLGDSIKTMDAVAIGLAVGGGALIATGLVLFLTDSGESSASLSAGPGSLHFSGRF